MHSVNTFSRYPKPNKTNYELSSKGDTRFSPLIAKLADGRTLEEVYQLDIKGYRSRTDNWRDGKGKPPLNGLTIDQLYIRFRSLLYSFLKDNPELLKDFITISVQYENFTDMFAHTKVNQARAYCDIANHLRQSK